MKSHVTFTMVTKVSFVMNELIWGADRGDDGVLIRKLGLMIHCLGYFAFKVGVFSLIDLFIKKYGELW